MGLCCLGPCSQRQGSYFQIKARSRIEWLLLFKHVVPVQGNQTKSVQDHKETAKRLIEDVNRGLTDKNIQLGIISQIGYFQSPIGEILSIHRWGISYLTLL